MAGYLCFVFSFGGGILNCGLCEEELRVLFAMVEVATVNFLPAETAAFEALLKPVLVKRRACPYK